MDVSCKICLNMRSIIFVFSLFRFLWAGLWVKQRLSPIIQGFEHLVLFVALLVETVTALGDRVSLEDVRPRNRS